MKVQNSLATKEKKSFSAVISGDGAQKLIRASLRDENAVKRFTGTLISVVNASEQLKECDAGSIISAALRGEGAGLIYGQGYYVVPYGTTATYMTSYKGWIQLAIGTGYYSDIDAIEVREGERKGRDPRTGKPVIDMSVYDTDEEREEHPVVGIKAYFLLKDGYYREEYWTMREILRHADRYSKAFSLELYDKWQRGEQLTKEEAYKVANGSPWFSNTLKMAKKTVLKSLLTSGYAPLTNEVKSLLNSEPESGEAVIPDIADSLVSEPVIETTGEVVEPSAEAAEASQSDFDVQPVKDMPEPQKPAKRGRKPHKAEPVQEPETEDDVLMDFFGDEA